MPFFDLQTRLGIDVDKWLLLQSGKQVNHAAGRCHAFEKEWVECSHGIGKIRADKECKLEYEDFMECVHRTKTNGDLPCLHRQNIVLPLETIGGARQTADIKFSLQLHRLKAIKDQMQKLEKEGKYKAPDFSKEENRP